MRVAIILLFATLTIVGSFPGSKSLLEECCENNGVPDNCIRYCRRKHSNPRSIVGMSEEKSKKFKSVCSKYDEILKNCLKPYVDEGNPLKSNDDKSNDLSESHAGTEKAAKPATVGKFLLVNLIDEP